MCKAYEEDYKGKEDATRKKGKKNNINTAHDRGLADLSFGGDRELA
jgi:hypothetical protein